MTESGDWRSRRWEQTHRRIHDIALALFQEHGFDQVNVGQIAKDAGVSVPTFYAHFPSKEHLIMQLPSADDFVAVLATQPAELPLADRFQQAIFEWLAQEPPEFRADAFARWSIIAATPSLRIRAAEFERTTGGVVADSLTAAPGDSLPAADEVIVHAYMAAFTAALLAWADCRGERSLEEILHESFGALRRR